MFWGLVDGSERSISKHISSKLVNKDEKRLGKKSTTSRSQFKESAEQIKPGLYPAEKIPVWS